jgi:urease accessory protein|uniref:HupE/UreJ protein n=1 Tax=uncultured bacterium UPO47 TaxID=1776972 RepID=A0A126SY80_9BACT|nr:HupE/UreJ protein [uncultured bacterium UPO47]
MKHAMTARLAAAALGAVALPVLAHPGHALAGWNAGLLHPLSGVDHLLAMLAVGLWSAFAGPAARAALGPGAFVAGLLLGAALAMAGPSLPMVEPGIALGMIALGLLLATALRVPAGAGLAVIAICGVLHGHAHGAEAPVAAGFTCYVAGFVSMSVLLHAAGWALAAGLRGQQHVLRGVAAAVLGASGAALLLG